MHSQILTNALIATMPAEGGYGLITDGCIGIVDGVIVFVGAHDDCPAELRESPTISLEGRLVTPGLIDCHTHIVYAGSRASEFEMRLEGKSYEEIARAGGGILSTVNATRRASDEVLLAQTLARIDQVLRDGVTTLEIKSGYGLDRDTELRMLRVARAIERQRPIRVRTTFLGAHTVPGQTSADTYLSEICLPTLAAAHVEGLVDAVDGFCEHIAFSPAQVARVFDTAKALNLPVKLHAEQLSDSGGAALAARYGALSADHLEYVSDKGIRAMADAGTAAVLLPGAFYTLREKRQPPVAALMAANVPIAVATDCNPGSSPMTSLLLAMNMAATLFGMTPQQCLRGTTVNAAAALGLSDCGSIATGLRADLAVWDCDHPAELTYRTGDARLHARLFGGAWC